MLKPTDYWQGHLGVQEIELFSSIGSQITPVSIGVSSQYPGLDNLYHDNCIDGDKATACSTGHSANPWIRVTYACAGGKTPKHTKVVITNTPGQESRLSAFSVCFVNVSGLVDAGCVRLARALPSYTVTSHRGSTLHVCLWFAASVCASLFASSGNSMRSCLQRALLSSAPQHLV